MAWIAPLSAATDPREVGSKAHGLRVLQQLGLPVPPGFVLGTALHRAVRRDGRFPADLDAELAATSSALPGRVSVRSGAPTSMPGMMTTVLDVEPGALRPAIERVLASWDSPRAVTYRLLNGLSDDVGTAVVVQAMVYGDRDEHSGAGVAFSRDPRTGAPAPYGEIVFRAHGAAVVSGTRSTRPLTDLADREPAAWSALRDALRRVERHYRDICQLEFTLESGHLWLLQVRPGGAAAGAAAAIAVGLVDDGVLSRAEAVGRVTAEQLRAARTPRLDPALPVLTRGEGASPGVASGRVATTADAAVRLAASGPVVLVRPTTSPADLHGLAAASGVLTFRGGPTSHAAVVARSMGKPAVVGATEIALDEGLPVTIDGGTGAVAAGVHTGVPGTEDPAVRRLLRWVTEVHE